MGFNLGDIITTIKVKTEGAKEAGDGISNVTDKAEEGANKLGKLADGFKDFAKVTGAALTVVGAGLTVYAKKANDFTVDYVSNAKQIARETGATVEQASQLTFVLGRLGISAEDASGLFGIFSKKIQGATSDSAANQVAVKQLQSQMEQTKAEIDATTKEIQKNGDSSGDLGRTLRGLQADYSALELKLKDTGSSFDKLGIEVTDNTGKQKDFHTILLEVADKFKQMPDGIEKTALSMDLFGRSGKDMIKVLNLGSQGISDLEKESDRLGLTLNQQTIGAVAAYIESQKKVKENADAIKIAVGTLTAPVMTDLSNRVADLTGKFQDLNPQLKQAVATFLAFGGPVLTAAGGFLTFLGAYDQAKPALEGIIGKIPLVGKLFNALSAFLTNPWVLVIIGISAVVLLLLDHFGKLQPMVDAVTNSMITLWGILQESLQPAFESIKSSLAELAPYWPIMREALKVIAEIIGGAVVSAIILFATALTGIIMILAYVGAGLTDWVSFMVTTWDAMWYSITGGMIVFLAWVKAAFNDAIGWISSKWNELAALPGRINAWLASIPGIIGSNLAAAVNTIAGWIGTFYNSGKALFEAFGHGISDAVNSVKDNVNAGLAKVRKLLPFSDAKEGPLSDLTLSGRRLMSTIAEGVSQGAPGLYAQVSSSLSASVDPVVAAGSPGGSTTISNGGGVTIQQVIINKDADSDYFFRKLGHNLDLSGRGITTQTGSAG